MWDGATVIGSVSKTKTRHNIVFVSSFQTRLIRQTYTERRRLAPEYMGSNTHTPTTPTADESYKYHRTRVRSDSYTIFYFKPPYAIGSVPSLSGHAIAYRWRSLPRVRRHRASKPQGSSERVLPWQVTIDQITCTSLSHTHYWYAVVIAC